MKVYIKFGHRFKFCLDDGTKFVVSKHYDTCIDVEGNHNNLYQFHQRSPAENDQVFKAYPVLKMPKLKP